VFEVVIFVRSPSAVITAVRTSITPRYLKSKRILEWRRTGDVPGAGVSKCQEMSQN
jgi:hypothetical protein